MPTATENATQAVVLLVEHDVLVRMTLASYLRECGYRVVEAVDGTEALTVLRHAALEVDAVLTDAVLPGSIDGFGLAQWLRQNKPDIQVLIAGTPARAAAGAAKLCEDGPTLEKPYDPQIVESRIRRLLAARQRRP
jgi:CheY-like chemotaxis protein